MCANNPDKIKHVLVGTKKLIYVTLDTMNYK